MKITVDCLKNDPVDIKAGGAPILAYDFYVEEKEVKKLVDVIKNTITELKLPLIGINIIDKNYTRNEDDVWRKEKIINDIIEESDVIISEVNRQNIYKNNNF